MRAKITGLIAAATLASVVMIDRSGLMTTQAASSPGVAQGRAKVVDGDSLEVAGHRIRLFGIDAPEGRQQCRDRQGQSYACGDVARDALRAMIGRSEVRCERVDTDRYGRWVSDCYVGSENLNRALVRQGYAVAYSRYSKKYVADEAHARSARMGLWSGQFERPSKWRAQRR